ncbi:hypothetical protein WA026_005431 [Henosepilachna vigintioctopunctata]|uniref:Protein takeout n=1 Tax=Henosepilachna vigintioctopunctata TaxID=420089 RepID=A0AAW1U1V5_9CUCU
MTFFIAQYIKDLRCSPKKDFKNCFITNGNKIIPQIAKGLPELHVPKLNPLELPFLQLISTPTLNLNLSSLKIHGLEDMIIKDVRLLENFGGVSLKLGGKNMTVEGNYNIDGKVLILPIRGNGHFSIYLKNGIYSPTVTTELQEKNGKKHYKSTGSKLNYSLEKITFDLENLFDGNEQLGDEMNKFLNENWDVLAKDFGPGIANIVSALHRRIFDEFTSEIPISDLLLN